MLHRDLIAKHNPFFAFDTLLDNLFSEDGMDSHWMRSDIQETDKAFQILVDLPGLKKDQVEVSLEDGRLVIEVKQEEKGEGKKKDTKYIRIERHQQRNGRRVFQVGKGVDENSIQAHLADGVLQIELAKTEPEQHKRLIELN